MSIAQHSAVDFLSSAKARVASVVDRIAAVFEWVASHFKVIVFNLAVLPGLGLIYWTVNSVGLRLSVPVLATKLYKLPLPHFSRLGNYHGLRDLDLANIAALGMLVLVWIFTVLILHIVVRGGLKIGKINPDFTAKFVLTVGFILIVVDAATFFHGIGEQAGLLSGGGVSLMQILLTIAYTTVIFALAFLHLICEPED